MPKCKECGETITKFDKEICPYCGCKDPIDKTREQTCDITQAISKFEVQTKPSVEVKEHKRSMMVVLCCLLGFLGVDAFYLGYKKEGFLRILASLLLSGGLFTLFYFFVFNSKFIFPLIIALSSLFIINIIFTIIVSLKRKKDANGVFIR